MLPFERRFQKNAFKWLGTGVWEIGFSPKNAIKTTNREKDIVFSLIPACRGPILGEELEWGLPGLNMLPSRWHPTLFLFPLASHADFSVGMGTPSLDAHSLYPANLSVPFKIS